jgi:hypothetical protein
VETAVLVAVVVATSFNLALQYATQVATYPLFAHLGRDSFVGYHQAWERRLPLTIYAPYGALVAADVLLLALRPPGVALGWVLALLALTAAVTAISVLLAVPVHRKLDRIGEPTADGVRGLLVANGLRLASMATATAIAVGLLAGHVG